LNFADSFAKQSQRKTELTRYSKHLC